MELTLPRTMSGKQNLFARNCPGLLTRYELDTTGEEMAMKTCKAALTMAWLAAVCALVLFVAPPLRAHQRSASAHVPTTGSAERKAITDGLRGDQTVIFKIHYLKAHGDWAWIDVTPLDEKGKPVAEGGTSLMHRETGGWKVMDLSGLPDDPNNPMQEPTPKFVKQLQRKFPGLPADIFPRK